MMQDCGKLTELSGTLSQGASVRIFFNKRFSYKEVNKGQFIINGDWKRRQGWEGGSVGSERPEARHQSWKPGKLV